MASGMTKTMKRFLGFYVYGSVLLKEVAELLITEGLSQASTVNVSHTHI